MSEAGATTPVSARPPDRLGSRNSWIFGELVARGVFVVAKPGSFYLDEIAAEQFVRHRKSRVLWIAAAAIVLWLLVLLVMSVA